MLIIGIILSFVGLGYLCWLIFALAVYALPLFAGLTVGLAAYHSGSGPIAAIAVAASVSVIVLLAGQIAFRSLRSPAVRAAIALLFAMPAAVAGYHAAHGLAHLVVPIEAWRETMGFAGAIIACARITLSARMMRAGHCRSRRVAHPADGMDQTGCEAVPRLAYA